MSDEKSKEVSVYFEQGTLLIEKLATEVGSKLSDLTWDPRTSQWRAPASAYREFIQVLTRKDIAFNDEARKYKTLSLKLKNKIQARPHQNQALERWLEEKKLGTVCIPTGGGKTILAVLAMEKTQRSTLIVVPTIDLMQQWSDVLEKFIGGPIGLIGGGSYDIQNITISTYDSAHLHIERLGNLFGLLIFDECHHLPGEQYKRIALSSLAPFRLGLSATIERSDGKQELIFELVGPLVYEGQVQDMVGQGLAPYDIITKEVPLTDEEREEYESERALYLNFVRQQKINFSHPQGWQQFIFASSRSKIGKRAMQAFRKQKKLAQASANKLQVLWDLIQIHVHERMLVFTDDNALAYKIGHLFFLPVLTHKTKIKERKKMLESFREGKIKILVTSKVLNEGVDVPEASIGIVVSGSGTVREHVQRLGRILRHSKGKRATMYELVSQNTSELNVNKRRREHHAYQGSA